MTLTTLSVWLVPYSNEPTISYPMWTVPPAAIAGTLTFVGLRHYDSFADRAPVYFTCGCPALKWVRESRLLLGCRSGGPDGGRRGTHPIVRKLHYVFLSLPVHAIPLPVAPMPAVRYDLNGGLQTCIRFIIYQEYMVIVCCYVFCKPDMVFVSILVE